MSAVQAARLVPIARINSEYRTKFMADLLFGGATTQATKRLHDFGGGVVSRHAEHDIRLKR
jgi:hypothetical protein